MNLNFVYLERYNWAGSSLSFMEANIERLSEKMGFSIEEGTVAHHVARLPLFLMYSSFKLNKMNW